MHTWTENLAGRGCEEIISSLLAFFDNEEVNNARNLIAWSDSCAGQNKNFYIIAFWQMLLAILKIRTDRTQISRGWTYIYGLRS